jgi:exosortase/archaeosortase family protein
MPSPSLPGAPRSSHLEKAGKSGLRNQSAEYPSRRMSPSRWPKSPSHGTCPQRFCGCSRNRGFRRNLGWCDALYGYASATDRRSVLVGPYLLLVQDACSGMNSIFARSAFGFFYLYLLLRGPTLRKVRVRLPSRYKIARVMALVLISYYAGIGAIEGPFHEPTGIALFVIALLMLLLFGGLLVDCGAAFRWVRPSPASLAGASFGKTAWTNLILNGRGRSQYNWISSALPSSAVASTPK